MRVSLTHTRAGECECVCACVCACVEEEDGRAVTAGGLWAVRLWRPHVFLYPHVRQPVSATRGARGRAVASSASSALTRVTFHGRPRARAPRPRLRAGAPPLLRGAPTVPGASFSFSCGRAWRASWRRGGGTRNRLWGMAGGSPAIRPRPGARPRVPRQHRLSGKPANLPFECRSVGHGAFSKMTDSEGSWDTHTGSEARLRGWSAPRHGPPACPWASCRPVWAPFPSL